MKIVLNYPKIYQERVYTRLICNATIGLLVLLLIWPVKMTGLLSMMKDLVGFVTVFVQLSYVLYLSMLNV